MGRATYQKDEDYVARKMALTLVIADQSLRNREFVRRLLKQKQPAFAAALELAVTLTEREPTEPPRRGKRCTGGSRPGRRAGRVEATHAAGAPLACKRLPKG